MEEPDEESVDFAFKVIWAFGALFFILAVIIGLLVGMHCG